MSAADGRRSDAVVQNHRQHRPNCVPGVTPSGLRLNFDSAFRTSQSWTSVPSDGSHSAVSASDLRQSASELAGCAETLPVGRITPPVETVRTLYHVDPCAGKCDKAHAVSRPAVRSARSDVCICRHKCQQHLSQASSLFLSLFSFVAFSATFV